MRVTINGNAREFPGLPPSATVADLVAAMELKGDRVAVEQNGEIVRRPDWNTAVVSEGDRFEVVHFVGGGSGCTRRTGCAHRAVHCGAGRPGL